MNGVFRVTRNELGRMLHLRLAFATLVLSVVIYAALYPQPYVNEALRNAPIAVVDLDRTEASRQLVRNVDATPDVAVALELPDVVSAERAVYAREVFGILLIPQHFERDLLAGRPSPIALYGDASYFLMFSRISGGVTAVAQTLGAEVETARLIGLGVEPVLAAAVPDPLPLTVIPLFNPEGGYATYILPAAFVLILQQTLLIGVGLLGTLKEGSVIDPYPGAIATVCGKLLAYLALELLVLPFYLIALPYLYGVPRLGEVWVILLFGLPFVLAVGGLGMVIAALFRNPLSVQLVFASIGLPFFFLAGFSWPVEAIPPLVRDLSVLLPSTAAISGFVRVSQMGAPLYDVRPQFLTLWALAIAYGSIAVFLAWRSGRGKSPLLQAS